MVLSKRYLDQWDRIGNSEIDSHVFGARKTIYSFPRKKSVLAITSHYEN